MLALILSACGGGLTSLEPGAPMQLSTDRDLVIDKAIPESEIARLSERQRALLADPGWNTAPATAIGPAADQLPAPSHDLLMEVLQQQFRQQLGSTEVLRHSSALDPVPLGAYRPGDVNALGIPDFGCNADAEMLDIYHIEDVISGYPLIDELNDSGQQTISYVDEYLPAVNHFTAGVSESMRAAVIRQFLATADEAAPEDSHISSVAYPVLPDYAVSPGGGTGPGGPLDCGITAYSVRDAYWLTWNERGSYVPDGNSLFLYDILPAPLQETGELLLNPLSGSAARRQPFLFGSWQRNFSGAWIIGIESADSGCIQFDDLANLPWYEREGSDGTSFPNILHVPLYGVTDLRWRQSAMPGGEDWNSQLGWPVTRPFAYDNGAPQFSADGTYHVFGQFFELGFIWWLDYDQQANPSASDRAIVYSYSGINAYCPGEYVRSYPDLHYNNEASAPLAADLLVDQYLAGNGEWRLIGADTDGRLLRLPWTDEAAGQRSATLRALVNPSGGVTVNGEDIGQPGWGSGLYRSCTWLWQDGTITPAGTDYDPAQFEMQHTYLAQGSDIEQIRRIRAQVVDADGNIVYVDSLPLLIGDSGPEAQPALSVLRADNGLYPSGYEALISDLGELGLPFSTRIWEMGIEQELAQQDCQLVIWYDGGPGSSAELKKTQPAWTAAERDSLLGLLERGIHVLLLSQDLGGSPDSAPGNSWIEHFGFTNLEGGATDADLSAAWGQLPGERIADFSGGWLPSSAQYLSAASLPTLELLCGAVERGNADDGPLPLQINTDPAYPISGLGHASAWPGSSTAFTAGASLSLGASVPAQALLSWGSTAAPHGFSGTLPDPQISSGTARFWAYGVNWAASTPLGFEGTQHIGVPRSRMLANILRWLDDDSRYFDPLRPRDYGGEPEILSVTPYLISPDGQIQPGDTSRTGVDYPDPSGSDVLRSTPGLSTDNHLLTDAARLPSEDGLNANDLDLQFPFYAYITWDDTQGQANGVLEPEEILGIDYGGLLLRDDADWQRADPVGLNYVQPSQLPLKRSVAGYYLSFSGDSGDEIRATYGSAAPQLATDQPGPSLLFEAVAHWPANASYGGQPPLLRWSMFPGHKVAARFDPAVSESTLGHAGENGIPWQSFVRSADIDPDVSAADPDLARRVIGAFSHVGDGRGRSMLFDYGVLSGFMGDLIPGGSDDAADKFPVRVRLITDYESYWRMDEPGLDWPERFPPSDSYLEGGCYVTLNGKCPLRIFDNPDAADPAETAIRTGGEDPVYDITLSFVLECGAAPYEVWLDYAYDGVNFGNSGQIQPVGTFNTPGAWEQPVSVDFTPAGGSGEYTFCLKVDDGAVPGNSAYYVWKQPVLVD
ncbi:hypothetical protein KDL44_05320 [bacterium]|nr:hypothetical protein [bacterium]